MTTPGIKSLRKRTLGRLSKSLKRAFREEILVIGDSHASVFKHRTFRAAFPSAHFNIVAVEGATVSGLQNPNSKTQANQTFLDRVETTSARTVVVQLGEVDTGFVIWYRAEKYHTPVQEMLDKALQNYEDLLLSLADRFRPICISAPLPTIQDDQSWGDVANARREIQATQRQRTQLTLEFNRHMERFCERHGLTYLSLDNESLGADGLVSPHLLHANRNDHHYARDAYAAMVIRKLEPVLAADTGR